MENLNFNKETVAFSKSAITLSFDALSTISGQAAVTTDLLLGAVPSVPEEGKKVASLYFAESQKSLTNLKKHAENSLDIDWSAKDAPVKSLDVLANFYKDAFSQAAEFRNETKGLVEKGVKQLPKETRSIVDFWNDSFNSGFVSFQGAVNKNIEMARKIAADIFVVAPVVQAKAAK